MELALHKFRDAFGSRIASVIHLVAYFDFTGEENPLYQSVTVDGTRRLLRALRPFEVEQFVYASTMLVHAPCRPGERIDESQPIEPRWSYPKSKAAAEEVIRAEHKQTPYVILRLAGVYDERSMVPTMAQQIARIYERDFQSHFYSGSTLVGQAMLHRDDMLEAFRRTVDRRERAAAGSRGPDRRARCRGLRSASGRTRASSSRRGKLADTARAKARGSRRSLGAGGIGTRYPGCHRQGRGAVHQALHGRHGRRPLRPRHPARSRHPRVGAAAPAEGRTAAPRRRTQGRSRRAGTRRTGSRRRPG